MNLHMKDETTGTPKREECTELLLIVKWGGDLTPLGREQAETLGAMFRQEMYPGNSGGGM